MLTNVNDLCHPPVLYSHCRLLSLLRPLSRSVIGECCLSDTNKTPLPAVVLILGTLAVKQLVYAVGRESYPVYEIPASWVIYFTNCFSKKWCFDLLTLKKRRKN